MNWMVIGHLYWGKKHSQILQTQAEIVLRHSQSVRVPHLVLRPWKCSPLRRGPGLHPRWSQMGSLGMSSVSVFIKLLKWLTLSKVWEPLICQLMPFLAQCLPSPIFFKNRFSLWVVPNSASTSIFFFWHIGVTQLVLLLSFSQWMKIICPNFW